ncbi:MAG TPA: NosD domain-containing protein [Actinomycetota bacterium]|nr:NosD domain-containing protein [Actinomycetota bacterium]
MLAPLLVALALGVLSPSVPLAQGTGSHEHHAGAAEIQARIDAAAPGDVVHVEAGMYHGNLLVHVPVALHGMDRPVIQGDGTGSVVTVTAPGVVLSGLLVRGSAPGPVGGPAGVRVEAEADGAVIRDVIVEDSYAGIAVYGARGVRLLENTIRGRVAAEVGDEGHAIDPDGEATPGHEDHAAGTGVFSRGDGISLWDAHDVLVRDNDVAFARDGVFLSFGRNLLIDRNRISDSRYALHSMFSEELTISDNTFERNLSGAVMMYGGPALVVRNRILDSRSPSTGFGALLKDVGGVELAENVLTGNRVGIQVDGPPAAALGEVRIYRNTVALNRFGVSLYPSARATFFANSFVENGLQVIGQGTGVAGKNSWVFEGTGNYWSDYRGYDLAGDGIGDVAYVAGGAVEGIVRRAPVLAALASGPAFGLIRAVGDRWIDRAPVVEDHRPLMRPASPAATSPAPNAVTSAALGAAGLAGVVLAGLTLVAVRRPIRRGRRRRA